ncbi:MAG: hypothetical protein M1832_001970 [Thelocarpon impressellum]|nr:MAG: hypothetical protein M1832_001970 [Thelocarpon impressellum]
MAYVPETSRRATRVVSVVAATLIALACGTNYVYSAWAPQFAAKLNLSSTESNLIGTAANLGMYATGIPVAYDGGPGSMSVPLLCFFSLLTGLGSCAAFSASLKTSALNWPNHRGTATAFPLAGFGLSAFFFAELASIAFPENTSDFLFLLAVGTFTIVFVSFFFLRVAGGSSSYSALPSEEGRVRSDSNKMHRTKSDASRHGGSRASYAQPSTAHEAAAQFRHEHTGAAKDLAVFDESAGRPDLDAGECSPLTARSDSTGPGDFPPSVKERAEQDHPALDIRGFALLPEGAFWQLFITLGLLSGVGLMTINNIGNDAQALWSHYDDTASTEFIQARQLVHVSILSVASFAGRLLSGMGSDFIVKRLHMSRSWCLVAASSIFCLAQLCAVEIENPNGLWAVSGLTGLGYGVLYGVYPAMVTEAFGVHGFSQNWGCMTLAPIISGNVFNLLYGGIYDAHSTVLPSGERVCPDGLKCYRAAYIVTLCASLLGLGVSLWSIRTEHGRRAKMEGEELDVAREA